MTWCPRASIRSPSSVSESPQIGVVVLTQGRRPAELERALRSVLAQRGVATDVVVVGNGWAPDGLPEGVRTLHLPDNVGIPAGRNAGVPHVVGDLVLFLDDDALLPDVDFLATTAGRFGADPTLGLLQPRVDVAGGGTPPRRWVPRLRSGDRHRPSDAFSVWEGAVVARRQAFTAAGGWPESFFYAHEGIELAWRTWDAGFRVWYAGDLAAEHPLTLTTRHRDFYRLNARNRVWLARRNLPWALGAPYIGIWTAVQIARSWRSPATLQPWVKGWLEGWRSPAGPRMPLHWRTIARMARLGRLPVL
jgi:GT2 family glycosyltransferase